MQRPCIRNKSRHVGKTGRCLSLDQRRKPCGYWVETDWRASWTQGALAGSWNMCSIGRSGKKCPDSTHLLQVALTGITNEMDVGVRKKRNQ